VATQASDILRFYGSLMNDVPYRTMSIAVVEDELPGGHSPAYATVLNSPPPASQLLWRNDPAAFLSFPEFFLAHEMAHQWWGQAVGWKNYHEQWISEGFAQYFSALYAQKLRGDSAFVDMLRQFRRWGMSDSDEGPVYLGYRLGHVKGDTRIFRALVYNKGAAVLHMLRRLVGDDAFFRGLRRFYTEQRYQKAGTDDLARAMEAESGMPLDRFFERWIYGSDLPRLRYTTRVIDREVTVRFEQMTEDLFDVPVTITIVLTDGRVREVVIPVTEQKVERTIPVDGPVRQVQVNRDSAALAEFDAS
jgi:aminopeptidase N